MELEFKYFERDGWCLTIPGDSNEYPVIPKDDWVGDGVAISTDVMDLISGEPITGDLKLSLVVNGTHDPSRLASIVCIENSKFAMPVRNFKVSDEFFNPGRELEDTLSFKLPASFTNTAEILSEVRLTYRQLAIFREFFKTNKALGQLRGAEGVVLHDKLSHKCYLLTNHNRTALEALWHGDIPEPLSENEEGALYLYDTIVRKDQILVNASAFFNAQ